MLFLFTLFVLMRIQVGDLRIQISSLSKRGCAYVLTSINRRSNFAHLETSLCSFNRKHLLSMKEHFFPAAWPKSLYEFAGFFRLTKDSR